MRRILLTAAFLGIAASAGAQAPAPKWSNPLGIKGYSSPQPTERQGDVVHLSGKALVWFENSTVIADEAFINFATNHIEFKGNVVMKPR